MPGDIEVIDYNSVGANDPDNPYGQAEALVDYFLSNPEQPVMISYCSAIHGRNDAGESVDSEVLGRDAVAPPFNVYKTNEDCGSHAAIIYGMRCHEGKVEFRLKNSWGSDWGENGSTWVSAAHLAPNLSNFMYLEKTE